MPSTAMWRTLLYEEQGGRCAWCREPLGDEPGVVDHDHACCDEGSQSCGRCIRGLVHNKCNTYLIPQAERYLQGRYCFTRMDLQGQPMPVRRRRAEDRRTAAEVRAWAKAQGIMLASRGRIPIDVTLRYQTSLNGNAHPEGGSEGD